MCYTLYITHNIVISACAHFFRRAHYAPPLEVWLVTMAVVLAFGLVYFILIERPCMDPNWPKRLWRRFFPEAAATTDPAV
jgi:peptidoglycan/LPS O-acetylase OafA/YrhL